MLDPFHGAEQASAEAFEARFGTRPTHQSRAPGRVNLIGEHIDYNGLAVLPMALQREARLALRPRDDGWVRVINLDPEFAPVEFEIGVRIAEGTPGDWGNYVKAPAQELARRHAIYRGFDAVFSSDIPVASGLSSSSALVNAVGLALSEINEVGLGALDLADLMAEAEAYTGTRGGGMDQAISMAGRAGHAARIDFAPLRIRHAPVPVDWLFVVADTGVRAEKSGPAQQAYNRRRAECEEAFALVATEMERRGRDIRPGGYRRLVEGGLAGVAMDAAQAVLKGNLLRRFRHVIGEGGRVRDAQDALQTADHVAFGTLMDASHGSLRTDYHVSSKELDDLVALAKEGGAAGARLTGAGFGGCIVALTSPETVTDVLETLVWGYYRPRQMEEGIERRLFVAEPSDGASYGPF